MSLKLNTVNPTLSTVNAFEIILSLTHINTDKALECRTGKT